MPLRWMHDTITQQLYGLVFDTNENRFDKITGSTSKSETQQTLIKLAF